jgi:hypothetical protein
MVNTKNVPVEGMTTMLKHFVLKIKHNATKNFAVARRRKNGKQNNITFGQNPGKIISFWDFKT